MPVQRRALGQLDARLAVVGVEQAQLDALRVLGEDREVRPLPVPGRAEREGGARPDLHQRTSAPASGGQDDEAGLERRLVRRQEDLLGALARDVHRGAGEVGQQRALAAADGQPAGALVEDDLVHVPRRQLAAGAQQLRVQLEQALRLARARQLRALEGRDVLRVGHLLAAELGEGGELAPAALAGRVGDLGVDVVGEELKRRPLAVLLALEQHGREG